MSQQAQLSCHAKHQWLLGMLGPCPLRRRSALTSQSKLVSTRRLVFLHTRSYAGDGSRLATSDGVGSSRTSAPPVDPLGEVLPSSSQSVDKPVQLASKPQPRPRARMSPPSPLQPSTSGSDLEGPNTDGSNGVGPSSFELKPPQEPLVLGIDAKAAIVQRKTEEFLQKRAAALAQQQADAASAAEAGSRASALIDSVQSTLHPRTGERMPQLRIAQMRLQYWTSRTADSQAGQSTTSSQGDGGAGPGALSPSGLTADIAASAKFKRYGAPWEPKDTPDAIGAGSAPASASASSARWGSSPLRPGSSTSTAVGAAAVATTSTGSSGAALVSVPLTRAQLEALVRSCTDLGSLRAVYEQHAEAMDHSEVVTVIQHLASFSEPALMTVRLWTATQATLVELLQRVTPKLPDFTMQEFVVVLAAVAKLRYVPPSDWIAAVLTQSKRRLYNASPAYLTTIIRAMARLTVNPSDVKDAVAWEAWMKRFLSASARQVASYRADELVKTLVAMSELRYQPPAQWMARFSGALHSKLRALDAHSLSEAMLAFAALRYQPEAPFLREYYQQLYSRLPLADDRDLATFAQATSLLDRLIRQEFMHEFLAEVLQKLPTFKPRPLSNLLNAMGRLAAATPSRLVLPPGWSDEVARHISGSRRLKTFDGSSLASTAWGLSVLGHKASPQFLDDLLSASYGKLHTCGPTDLILLLTALGNFGFKPMPGREGMWDTWLVEFEKLTARKTLDTRGVCDLMAALARVPRPVPPDGDGKPRPPHPEMIAGVLRSTRISNMRKTSPSRLAAMLAALATLGVKPDFGFLYNMAQVARFMWAGFSMRDYATLLAALVDIGSPSVADPRWAGDFLAIIMCRMHEFDGPGLTVALDALRRLPKPEFQPGEHWLAAAAQRAVDLVRSPPPRQAPTPAPEADGSGGSAAAAEPPPAAAAATLPPTGPVDSYLSFRPGGSRAGVGGVVQSPEGRAVPVPPMEPLTPEHMVVVMRSLAELGYRTGPDAPLAEIVRRLLAKNSRLWEMAAEWDAAGGAAAAQTARRQEPQPQQGQQQAGPQHQVHEAGQVNNAHNSAAHLTHRSELRVQVQSQDQQPQQNQESEPSAAAALGSQAAAAAAEAFERAKAAAAAAASRNSHPDVPQRPRPLLSRVDAADLEKSLAVLLNSPGSGTLAGVGKQGTPLPAVGQALGGGMTYPLPRGVVKTPEDVQRAEAMFLAKINARKARAAARAATQTSVSTGSEEDASAALSSSAAPLPASAPAAQSVASPTTSDAKAAEEPSPEATPATKPRHMARAGRPASAPAAASGQAAPHEPSSPSSGPTLQCAASQAAPSPSPALVDESAKPKSSAPKLRVARVRRGGKRVAVTAGSHSARGREGASQAVPGGAAAE